MKNDKLKENSFSDKALDCITDYVASKKMSRKKLNFFECVNYMSERMNYSVPKIVNAFGQLVRDEIDRVTDKTNSLKESTDTFSSTLLKEDENAEVAKQVDDAKTKNQKSTIEADERNKSDKSIRKYYLYMNLEEGAIYICGKTEETEGLINKTLIKLNNFLEKCVTPTLSKHGILIAPISYELAKKYLDKFKGVAKYLDITPTKQENSEQK